MTISIVTLFPGLYEAFLSSSLIGRAQKAGLVSFDMQDMRSVCRPKERVDGPAFGHHPGMVIRPEVIERLVQQREEAHGPAYKIFFSPRGERLTQDLVREIVVESASYSHMALFAARYEGMDERVEEEYANRVISVGDFVVMGGDIPAQLFLEAYLRYIPGIVGDAESVEKDSFTGPFLDCPAYTAPAVWHDRAVPEVIRSGDHAKIDAWIATEGAQRAVRGNFDWVRSHATNAAESALVAQAMPHHYIALLHGEVLLPGGIAGTTSVTSIDIHDIARSARTYGVQGYFIVTPLQDQQAIVKTLLSFWQEGEGTTYNPHRAEALAQTVMLDTLDAAVAAVEAREGKRPLVIATSAREVDGIPTISYHDQRIVWTQDRPVLLLFGTGRGLAPSVYTRVDYVLMPIRGYQPFNHLSVRSAAAIVLDRWLGSNPVKAHEASALIKKSAILTESSPL